MFEGEAHQGYRDLCRKQRLPREWQPGDVFGEPGSEGAWIHIPSAAGPPDLTFDARQIDDAYWLPRLDQLCDLLVAANCDPGTSLDVTLDPISSAYSALWGWDASDGGHTEWIEAPTREEAALRYLARLLGGPRWDRCWRCGCELNEPCQTQDEEDCVCASCGEQCQ